MKIPKNKRSLDVRRYLPKSLAKSCENMQNNKSAEMVEKAISAGKDSENGY